MSSPLLLHLNTAVEGSSVALSKGSALIKEFICPQGREGSKLISVYLQRLLADCEVDLKNVDGLAVCRGPGSYTGLRIGLALAKGLSMATGVPLIGVNSLEALAAQAFLDHPKSADLVCAMIDARRMEAYVGIYAPDGEEYAPVEARVIDKHTFIPLLNKYKVLFSGNAVSKVEPLYQELGQAGFQPLELTARMLILPALKRFENGELEDAYSLSPAYMKEYQAGDASKKIEGILKSG